MYFFINSPDLRRKTFVEGEQFRVLRKKIKLFSLKICGSFHFISSFSFFFFARIYNKRERSIDKLGTDIFFISIEKKCIKFYFSLDNGFNLCINRYLINIRLIRGRDTTRENIS